MEELGIGKVELEKFINYIPMIIIVVDEDLRIQYTNMLSDNIFNKIDNGNIIVGNYIGCVNSFESSKGCGYSKNCDWCKLRVLVNDTIKKHQPSDIIEIQINVLRGGKSESLWLNTKAIPIIQNGENQIIIAASNITEYKSMQNEVLAVNNLYYSIIKYFPDMLWKTDSEKNYVYFNENWEKLTGETREKLIKENFISGMHPDDVENYKKELIKAYKNKQTFRSEYRLKTTDGEYKNILSRANPIFLTNGQLSGFVGIDLDVTSDKKTREELLKLKEAAEAANKAKSEFLANMSHEIRTPLNGIIGMTDLTLSSELTQEQKENLNIVKNCAHTLLSLINNILDLSKLEAEKVIIEEIDFDIRCLIQKVIDTNLIKAKEKYIQLYYHIDENIPKILIGDGYRIEQILNNLISNAVKFTDNGIIMVNINKVNSFNDVYEIKFSVEDMGIGLSEEEMKYIFKSFTQVDGSITRKYGGTGLGLAISQELAELMGSHIEVESEIGIGSKFYFTIKLLQAKEKEIIEDPDSNINKEKVLKNESVLVVEDDTINKIVIKKMLNEIGYSKVKTAANGVEALKLIENIKFDIILMDIQMPELDGIETTQIIRENEKKSGEHIPIIAITAYALKGDKEKFLCKGMDDYISKPVNINELNEKLKEIEKMNYKNNDDIISAYLKNNGKHIGKENIRKETETDLLNLMSYLNSCFKLKKNNLKNYDEIEKIAHQIKSRAEENELSSIKALAFKIELAARKKDDIKIKDNFNKIYDILRTNA
ncbi:response regulator [Clostridium sp. C2-6-12]|uniref:response regulator n=1 Tax=Clostridium sp. C2-6-12 TaxID=2698832 RepID=UPI00192377A6|nr:response regulator [Clostridium sp. C2-6-12]